LRDRLSAHKEALENYYAGNFSAARKQFSELQATAPEDLYYPHMIEVMSKK